MSTMYEQTVTHFEKCLTNLDKWIDKSVDYAKSRNFEPDTLLQSRLAPDMFPLIRQLQSVCDQTKFVCARLTAKEVPPHADTEKTFDEIRARIASAREVLKGFKPADFDGSESRHVVLPFMPGKYILGKDYLSEFGLVNFHFHLSMVYAIMRHNGVPIGKMDLIGSMSFHDA